MVKRFKTINDVRRYLAGLIRRTEAGEIDPSLAGRLGYLCNILLGAIKDGSLETRVSQLEEAMRKKGTL
jgi:hypothetical protein